jgi:hypothetical protein
MRRLRAVRRCNGYAPPSIRREEIGLRAPTKSPAARTSGACRRDDERVMFFADALVVSLRRAAGDLSSFLNRRAPHDFSRRILGGAPPSRASGCAWRDLAG